MSDEHKLELARTYMGLIIPSVKGAVTATNKEAATFLERINFQRMLDPMAEVMAAELTVEELQQSIAHAESPLFAKLQSLQERMGRAMEQSMVREIARMLLDSP